MCIQAKESMNLCMTTDGRQNVQTDNNIQKETDRKAAVAGTLPHRWHT